MDFTLPFRPASNRGLARPKSRTDLRSAVARQVEPVNTQRNPEAASAGLPPPLRITTRTMPNVKSKSQLGPVNQDKVVKQNLRRKETRTGLRASRDAIAQVSGTRENDPDDAIFEAESWAILEAQIKAEASASEMEQSMKVLNLKPKQSMSRMRQPSVTERGHRANENILKAMKPHDLPCNVFICLSFRSVRTRVNIAPDVIIFANDLPTFAEFATQLVAKLGSMLGVMLLRAREPSEWHFRSHREQADNGGLVNSSETEYCKGCPPEDVDHVYGEFLSALFQKGQREARKAIERAQSRQNRAKKIQKGRAAYTVEGHKRKIVEFRMPVSVDVYGYVDVFLQM